jgi:hypothetical protein
VEHLKDLFSGPANEEFSSGLVPFANCYASGLSYLFNSAFLIPVKKRLGGIRPIAVGNIWRRIIGKCAMSAVRLVR